MGTMANVLRLCTVLAVALAVDEAVAADSEMVVVPGKDVKGEVFKRLGLPNQTYCWEQCVDDARCKATRWGVVGDSTAGQCQLISGEITYIEPHDIRTQDGLGIRVIVSRKATKGGAEPRT